LKTILVLTPVNTLTNWKEELHKWLPLEERNDFPVYQLWHCKTVSQRLETLQDWHDVGGVMVMGYDMFRNLVTPSKKLTDAQKEKEKDKAKEKDKEKEKEKDKEEFRRLLLDPGPDLVIADEAHLIKSPTSARAKAVKEIRTKRRVALTGTPVQNNMMEYYCMVDWVRPNFLGTLSDFRNRFENPIKNGMNKDSTNGDIRHMQKRLFVLHGKLSSFVQRHGWKLLQKDLPLKEEFVLLLEPSALQKKLLNRLKRDLKGKTLPLADGSNKVYISGAFFGSISLLVLFLISVFLLFLFP
jgi:SNF2 family DNA or RNA helicase